MERVTPGIYIESDDDVDCFEGGGFEGRMEERVNFGELTGGYDVIGTLQGLHHILIHMKCIFRKNIYVLKNNQVIMYTNKEQLAHHIHTPFLP